jgi:hypothetical protein
MIRAGRFYWWTLVLNIPDASLSPSFSNARRRRAHHSRYAAYLLGNSNVSDIGLGNILLSLPTIDTCIEYGEFSINTDLECGTPHRYELLPDQ